MVNFIERRSLRITMRITAPDAPARGTEYAHRYAVRLSNRTIGFVLKTVDRCLCTRMQQLSLASESARLDKPCSRNKPSNNNNNVIMLSPRLMEQGQENLGEMAVICGFDEGGALVDRQRLNEICSSTESCSVQTACKATCKATLSCPQQQSMRMDDESIKNNTSHRPQSWRTRIVVCLPSEIAPCSPVQTRR